MRHTQSIFLIASLSAAAWAADVARPSPPFTMQRIGAAPLKLSQYRGKVVALAFISTACSHCQQLTTELKLIAQDYAGRGVQFLECAFNEDALPSLPEFLTRFTPPFPVGYAPSAAVMSYLEYSPLNARPLYVPHMVFLDRAGVIRADFPGEAGFFGNANANIRAQLDKMLNAPAGAKKATK